MVLKSLWLFSEKDISMSEWALGNVAAALQSKIANNQTILHKAEHHYGFPQGTSLGLASLFR